MDRRIPAGVSSVSMSSRRVRRADHSSKTVRTADPTTMFAAKKVIVVMPAYNAARTLAQTHQEVLAQGVVDLVIVVDDASKDETTALARTLPNTIVHTHV